MSSLDLWGRELDSEVSQIPLMVKLLEIFHLLVENPEQATLPLFERSRPVSPPDLLRERTEGVHWVLLAVFAPHRLEVCPARLPRSGLVQRRDP
jgi:hypothetical protein